MRVRPARITLVGDTTLVGVGRIFGMQYRNRKIPRETSLLHSGEAFFRRYSVDHFDLQHRCATAKLHKLSGRLLISLPWDVRALRPLSHREHEALPHSQAVVDVQVKHGCPDGHVEGSLEHGLCNEGDTPPPSERTAGIVTGRAQELSRRSIAGEVDIRTTLKAGYTSTSFLFEVRRYAHLGTCTDINAYLEQVRCGHTHLTYYSMYISQIQFLSAFKKCAPSLLQ